MSEWRETTLDDFVALQRGHDLTELQRRIGRVPVMGSTGKNGFHDTALAKGPGSAVQAMGADKLKLIAAELITQVKKSVTIDWTLRESARAKIKVMVKRILNKHGDPPDLQEEAVKTVLAQAELLCVEWV